MALRTPDPVALSVGSFEVRWYGLCFAGGIALVWLTMRLLTRDRAWGIRSDYVDGVMVWNSMALVVGGRVGEMLFYQTGQWLADPWSVLDIDRGGMSFFGGMIGVAITLTVYERAHGIPSWRLFDLTAVAAPLGLGLGRVGNWLNGEFLGPTTNLAWATIAPSGELRHPVVLYQALMEGFLLFLLLFGVISIFKVQRSGGIAVAIFLIFSSISRFILDPLRPDSTAVGFLNISVSQYLCILFFMIGAIILAKIVVLKE
ncbi:prolipoprotein diacylglyceryl transferase [Sinorhizobium meliloti]|uniref:prolipoprotein diacylglyceryl transferase n=1 Tax=Rhizobium meliloti TaxID=382 RepID=UPI00129617B7|nr:prolipoprotein diacylglyceryl transferase [Sinorhizobium meliloti]MDW9593538.1 prolipoprotein diacylglyceryl transferase [Sinorhizobium meliloti]MDX0191714.1 prolipoprotein diacylglyceryl transferase [Sinorhizobium meliloti]MQV09060.1 prolipoprotein diacylglyceryl transferase [Sinorhizobium meliloti]